MNIVDCSSILTGDQEAAGLISVWSSEIIFLRFSAQRTPTYRPLTVITIIIIASDEPGGNLNLRTSINAQHKTRNKAFE